MRTKNRVLTLLAASALFAGSCLTLGATNAAAADWTFKKAGSETDGSFHIVAYNPSGEVAGTMDWDANPLPGGEPGDAFRVSDHLEDSWGMEATMTAPVAGLKATTRGQAAPYRSPWTRRDLREGTPVSIRLCAVRGTSSHCGGVYSGHA